MNLWQLPKCAVIGGRTYPLHTDYRDILEIFSYLDDPDVPQYLRWQIATALFFEGEIPEDCQQEAMEYLCQFLRGGAPEDGQTGPKLLDWQQDAQMIITNAENAARAAVSQDNVHRMAVVAAEELRDQTSKDMELLRQQCIDYLDAMMADTDRYLVSLSTDIRKQRQMLDSQR